MLPEFELLIALVPIALYLIVLGAINLRRQPYLLSGTREVALLGLALSGLAAIGPVMLFFPLQAASQFGSWIWVILGMFYLLLIMLWMLLARPRLVIYNTTTAQVRALLAEVAGGLDPQSRWAGDSLSLPNLNVQLYVESFDWMRNVAIVSGGGQQNLAGWQTLENGLRRVLCEITVPRNPRGYSMLATGLLVLASIGLLVMRNPQAVAQGLWQMLQV
jgi:hypothetical protein